MSKCAACGKFTAAADGVCCIKCSGFYEKACVQLTKSTKIPSRWTCPGCISKMPRKDNTETPVKGISPTALTSDVTATSVTSSAKNDERGLAQEMSLIRQEMRAIRQEMTDFTKKVESMLSLLGAVNERLGEVESRVSSLEDDISSRLDGMENRILAIEKQRETEGSSDYGELVRSVDLLKRDLNDRDQELLANDVEITGLPEVNEENPLHLVQLVASKLKVELEARDVVSAERVGTRRVRGGGGGVGSGDMAEGPRPLVVRLTRRDLRDVLLREARVRRTLTTEGFGLPGPSRRFYLNERLTRTNRHLFGKTRQLAKTKGWKYVWTRMGRIYVRQLRDTEAHRIRTEVDLDKVFGMR